MTIDLLLSQERIQDANARGLAALEEDYAALGRQLGRKGIDIDAVIVAGAFAVDGDAKAHRLAAGRGPKHEVKVARVKAIDDRAIGAL